MFLDCLSVPLANGRHDLAIKCWLGVESRLSDMSKSDQRWRAAGVACWDVFLEGRIAVAPYAGVK